MTHQRIKTKFPAPRAILIADVHYNQYTLSVADACLRMAVHKANHLQVPLVVAGDLHDTKANLRGECVNALIETFKLAHIRPYVLIGNHDRINEKSPEHSLNFLAPYCNLITEPTYLHLVGAIGVPYHHDREALIAYLQTLKSETRTIIMHQGLEGALPGGYLFDKSAIPHSAVKDLRVVSGHYHARQDLKTGKNGLFSYIGNPYTLGFSEANDPPKGIQILREDGSLEHMELPAIRKHVVVELSINKGALQKAEIECRPNDLLWVKVRGTKEQLKLDKKQVAEALELSMPFKLDLIPDDVQTTLMQRPELTKQPDLLDSLIDSLTGTSNEEKLRIKELWRSL